MEVKRIFAADLGASGGKFFAGIFEKGSFSLHEVHRFVHGSTTFHIADRSGRISERTYWDDVLIYSNFMEGLRKYRREIAPYLDSIGIDTWGSDGQFVTADGDLIGKVYCYRDHRLDDMLEKVQAMIDPAELYRITGIHFQPFNISNQLLWFFMNRPGRLQPGSLFLPMPTIFYYYLGGVKKVDSSWASVTQLMDARMKQWSKPVLEKLNIPAEVLPEIVAPGARMGNLCGQIAAELDLNVAVLTAVGSHDTASAYAAAPADDKGEALIISSGTWSLVGRLIPEPVTSSAAMQRNISNEGGIDNIRFLKNCMGTWIVQELRRIWRERDGIELSWDQITRLVEKAQCFTAFIDPDARGFYNPKNMEEAIAEFCRKTGQEVPDKKEQSLRVVYESLAMKYRMVNEEISEVCGKPSRVVHIVGGGSKNELLNQFTADALGLPVVAGPEEATAVGNIMVQAVGLGILEDLAQSLPLIRSAFPIKTFTPESHRVWSKEYDRFKKVISNFR